MRGLMGDRRLALRSLSAAPAVTIAAFITLALGTGATSAVFAVANGLVLRPLPVAAPEDLVITSATALDYCFQGGPGWSFAMWDRLRERAAAFDGAFAWTLSGGYFGVLGVNAVLGRTFTASARAGSTRTARAAGIHAATVATATRIPTAPTSVMGSRGAARELNPLRRARQARSP